MSFNPKTAKELCANLPTSAVTITDKQCLKLLHEYHSFYGFDQIRPTSFVWRIACDISANGELQKQPTELVIHHWQIKANAPTLLIVHGYLDHIGLYKKAIAWGLSQQFNVITFDLPGHGLSSGERANIESFDQYSKALLAVLDACVSEPNIQIDTTALYSLSQSTGSAVVANTILFFREHVFQHNIMLAPLVRSHNWSRLRWYYFFLRFLKRYTPRHFSRCSHDQLFLDFVKYEDPLQAKKIPTAWLGAMDQWSQKVKNSGPTDQALTIIQGDNDTTVDWRYNTPLLQGIFIHAQLHLLKDANHHLINESDIYWKEVASVMGQAVE